MRPVIIGTAGHVDHGKTTLVRALTGVDTDRLKEEKERGLTIDLGFAPFTLPDGRRAAIIDVPGHERFIKNMLAGVGGIDVVLLVIAADEGVMPQTQEHLDILTLLQVRQGIVVVTKADLVDQDWLELVQEEIRQKLQGTALEGAPVLPVSSVTGAGLDRLLEVIQQVTVEAAKIERPPLARLPIDRVFTVAGHGTVVTGTLWGGRLAVGEEVEILPLGKRARIRQIQVHDEPQPVAEAGQRVALNLGGVERQELDRGQVVVKPGLLTPTRLLDVRLQLLPSAAPLAHRTRVRFHHGTAEIMGRVRLMQEEVLAPGGWQYAQLFLEEPMVGIRGDLFVIRSYSPAHTIGGGRILETHPPYRRRRRETTLEEMRLEDEGRPEDLVLLALNRADCPLTAEEVIRLTLLEEGTVKRELARGVSRGTVISLEGEAFLSRGRFEKLQHKVEELLRDFYQRFPLRPGIPKEEVRSRLTPAWEARHFALWLQEMAKRGLLAVTEQVVALPGHVIQLSPQDQALLDKLAERLREGWFAPPAPGELQAHLGLTPKKFDELVKVLVEQGKAVKVAQDVIFHQEAVQQAEQIVAGMLAAQGEIETAAVRDRLGSSRKYTIALLEYFDQRHLTRRLGDKRVAGPALRSSGP